MAAVNDRAPEQTRTPSWLFLDVAVEVGAYGFAWLVAVLSFCTLSRTPPADPICSVNKNELPFSFPQSSVDVGVHP